MPTRQRQVSAGTDHRSAYSHPTSVSSTLTPNLQVPFRLTRMMVKAMEVSGIEGNFRHSCEETMRVLRGNKESVIAM